MKIKFKKVSKNYGIVSALKKTNFSINDGEFLLLIGPSGAGKSTILKLILGQIKPSSGQILINETIWGNNKKAIDQTRRKIGVIFQDYQLIPDKSIEENIALALDIVSYPKNRIQTRIDQVIEQVDLSTRRFLFPSQLSGGELQRTALARALAIEPEVILADEPTGNLDIDNSWKLIKLLKEINKSTGTTIILATHDLDLIES
ncbi:ATP-binding cassette domain-containing protein, partial [Patescibacteria group bacterium]|nr:ATP-binding cassette domain-containing protein [Patescibacteria group bacterium]